MTFPIGRARSLAVARRARSLSQCNKDMVNLLISVVAYLSRRITGTATYMIAANIIAPRLHTGRIKTKRQNSNTSPHSTQLARLFGKGENTVWADIVSVSRSDISKAVTALYP